MADVRRGTRSLGNGWRMIVDYDLTYEEYLNAGHAMAAGQHGRWQTQHVVAYAVGGAGVLLLFQDIPSRAVVAAGLLVVYSLFSIVYPVWTSYRKSSDLFEDAAGLLTGARFEATDDHLVLRTSVAEHRYLWGAFQKLSETRLLILLWGMGMEGALCVPKRILTAEEADHFRSLARRHLPGRAHGFPVGVKDEEARGDGRKG